MTLKCGEVFVDNHVRASPVTLPVNVVIEVRKLKRPLERLTRFVAPEQSQDVGAGEFAVVLTRKNIDKHKFLWNGSAPRTSS